MFPITVSAVKYPPLFQSPLLDVVAYYPPASKTVILYRKPRQANLTKSLFH